MKKRGARRGQVAQVYQIPASTKGWLQNQAITKMDPLGAYILDNFIPTPDALTLRNGSQPFAQLAAETTPVETIMPYISGALMKVLAACNGKIYDATAGGTTGAAIASGFGSNRWQWTGFATSGGQFLIAVNGVDPVKSFDGTTFATTAITGPTNKLSNVFSYANRLFFSEVGTSNIWYLAVNAIAGAATVLPLGPLLTKGGSIIAGADWTYEAGNSIVNFAALISDQGEVIVYTGTDPASISTWSLVGVFAIGRPIGLRCTLKIANDVAILCEDGLMPLSKAIQFDRAAASKAAFTWNIQQAFQLAYAAYGANFGWQILSYAPKNLAIINVPIVAAQTFYQYVMNVLTGAWCRFTGQNAQCYATIGDIIYMGTIDGRLFKADSGCADENTYVAGVWVSAFNDFKRPGISKSGTMIRPIIIASQGLTVSVGIVADFNIVNPTATLSFALPGASLWGIALWGIALWNAPSPVLAAWIAAQADGYQLAAIANVTYASGAPAVAQVCKITTAYILYELGNIL